MESMTENLLKPSGDKAWSHGALILDLVDHLRATDVVFHECKMGSSWLRNTVAIPDVLSMKKSYTKTDIRIYEVKISQSDLNGDLGRGKWERYIEYADRVYFAVPHYLDWRSTLAHHPVGVMVRGPNGWRKMKAAPLNKDRKPWDEDVWLSLLFSHVPMVRKEQKELDALERERVAIIKHDMTWLRFNLKNELGEQAQEIAKALDNLENFKETAYREVSARILKAFGLDARGYWMKNSASGVTDGVLGEIVQEYNETTNRILGKLMGLAKERGATVVQNGRKAAKK